MGKYIMSIVLTQLMYGKREEIARLARMLAAVWIG